MDKKRFHKPRNHYAYRQQYNGVWFRSRLEARWAVFFDNLHWQWTFEPRQYRLFDEVGQLLIYTPDFSFLFGEVNCFLEVKGVEPPPAYRKTLQLLADEIGRQVFLSVGSFSGRELPKLEVFNPFGRLPHQLLNTAIFHFKPEAIEIASLAFNTTL